MCILADAAIAVLALFFPPFLLSLFAVEVCVCVCVCGASVLFCACVCIFLGGSYVLPLAEDCEHRII